MTNLKPSLFGINKSNRDFSKKDSWGKNQFNSSFPASLCCYLSFKQIEAVYLSIVNGQFSNNCTISIKDVFGIDPSDENTFFAFESDYSPYRQFVFGTLPRTDLVIQKREDVKTNCLAGLEIKLTALPDNNTCNLNEECYGSEIVVRPNTIVYLACSIAINFTEKLTDVIPNIEITDWTEPKIVLNKIEQIICCIKQLSTQLEKYQKPFLIQPIWKTIGKSPILADNCLDVFIWSNAGFLHFISSIANPNKKEITRQTRTVIWLYKMLLEIMKNRQFDHQKIIDQLSYNSKNDKAFASAGNITNNYMKCARLTNPIITKEEVKNIILGDGQNLLSPERRFDAILVNSPELFA